MPKMIHQETMCCGYKRCPHIEIFDDGSIKISDDDTEAGSVGTIKIRPEAVDRLIEMILTHKK
jgi:hypothetical protein